LEELNTTIEILT